MSKCVTFPDTFMYSVSWEDPDVDKDVLKIEHTDVVLTLTGGGDNVFNYVLDGADSVYCVDLNPAQYHLMELKKSIFETYDYDKLWDLFGKGIDHTFDKTLMCVSSVFSNNETYLFWNKKKHYFAKGLYYYGSMGKIVYFVKTLCLRNILLNERIKKSGLLWKSCMLLIKWFIWVFINLLQSTSILWKLCGTPQNQIEMITKNDKRDLYEYVITSLEPVFKYSDLIKDNYFYFLILNGFFAKENCPRYLKEENYDIIKDNVERIHNINGSLLTELEKREYSKVILMDHMDWMDTVYIESLCKALKKSLSVNGRAIFRSSSLNPWFLDVFIKDHGFKLTKINCHYSGEPYMDRVNMYASFWLVTK